MNLAEKQQQLTAELFSLQSGQDRFARLVDRAKKIAPLSPALRIEENLLPGCLAKLWLVSEFRAGTCGFTCDSDSLIVKAIAGLLCEFYSGHAPAEILAHGPEFLAPLGITQHLTPNRRNALAKVWERIREFAVANLTAATVCAGDAPAAAMTKKLKYFDAHNHLQDARFASRQTGLLAACENAGVVRMVVNGACEEDWPQVLQLARENKMVLPSFGYHPWYLHERTPDWLKNLEFYLDKAPAAVGEIGLDRWKPDLPYAGQEEVFLAQLRLAAERNLPASLHCLRAWGRMLELLQNNPRPARGLVLHSFGGPAEMIPAFAKLGAYFSFPGYFLQEQKLKQRENFRLVPADRLLVETDAPDQSLPVEKNLHLLAAADEQPLNHPANIVAVYAGLAELRGEPLTALTAQVAENFHRVFGGL